MGNYDTDDAMGRVYPERGQGDLAEDELLPNLLEATVTVLGPDDLLIIRVDGHMPLRAFDAFKSRITQTLEVNPELAHLKGRVLILAADQMIVARPGHTINQGDQT